MANRAAKKSPSVKCARWGAMPARPPTPRKPGTRTAGVPGSVRRADAGAPARRELGNFGALSIVIGMLGPRAKPRCAAPVNCMQTGWLLAGLIARFALALTSGRWPLDTGPVGHWLPLALVASVLVAFGS